MEPIVRTANAAYLQTCQFLRLPFVLKDNTTLNQKFQLHHDVLLADTDLPNVNYIAIGNGGHRFTTGSDGIPLPEPIQHLPRHAALYNQLPFIMRTLDNDLPATIRMNYRLRVIEEHDGIRYAVYYLKVMDKTNTIPQLELREVDGSEITSTPYTPTISDLNPTAPAVDPGNVIVTSGNYIASTAKIPYLMDEWELNEFKAACEIIYGSENYAIISEIAICSGIDRSLVGETDSVSIGYVDAIAVQVMSFISVFYAAKFSNTGIALSFDIGSVEPLLF